MPEKLHMELKAALVYDHSSFAEFFNQAAEQYLLDRTAQKKTERKNGGNQDG